jgi:hypothetical protein
LKSQRIEEKIPGIDFVQADVEELFKERLSTTGEQLGVEIIR